MVWDHGVAGSNPVLPTKAARKRAAFSFMKYFVYILYSVRFDRFYIGQTNDIDQRVHRHNAGSEKATAAHIPWELVWFGIKESRADAMKLGKKLKNLTKQRIWEFIEKYN